MTPEAFLDSLLDENESSYTTLAATTTFHRRLQFTAVHATLLSNVPSIRLKSILVSKDDAKAIRAAWIGNMNSTVHVNHNMGAAGQVMVALTSASIAAKWGTFFLFDFLFDFSVFSNEKH